MRFEDIGPPEDEDDLYEDDDEELEDDDLDDEDLDDDDDEDDDDDKEDLQSNSPKIEAGEISWDVTEYQIKDWIEEKLDAEHVGWVEENLINGEDVPVYDTEAEVSEVLDDIPLTYMGLKNTAGIYITCSDGEAFVLFDDRPKSSIVKDKDYERGINGKIKDISKELGKEYLVTVKIINEKDSSRIAWCIGCGDED